MRRRFLALLGGFAGAGIVAAAQSPSPMKVLIKSAWGSADPTQAAFPFHHAKAFADAGNDVQIFLLGEAVSIMRTVVANSIVPVGWPPLSQALASVIEKKIQIAGKNATFADPTCSSVSSGGLIRC
jgi:predicted peroxiredoxin